MPETDTIPVSASAAVAATGPGLRYISGNSWAAWSGAAYATNGANAELYNFRSPSVGLKAVISFTARADTLDANALIGYVLKLNGQDVINQYLKQSDFAGSLDNDPLRLIIPPLTVFTMEAQTNDDSNIGCYSTIVADAII